MTDRFFFKTQKEAEDWLVKNGFDAVLYQRAVEKQAMREALINGIWDVPRAPTTASDYVVCRTCGKEGHQWWRCPENMAAPASLSEAAQALADC